MSSTALLVVDKTPGESILLKIPFYGKLDPAETITTAGTIAFSPAGLTVGAPAPSPDAKQIWVRVSGGTLGVTYTVDSLGNVTSGGNTIEGRVVMPIQF